MLRHAVKDNWAICIPSSYKLKVLEYTKHNLKTPFFDACKKLNISRTEDQDMTDMIDFLQWPAMASSLVAAWMVASQRSKNRKVGFWIFLLSNVLWVIWGISSGGWALVLLQAGLAGLNVRGVKKNEPD